MVPRDMPPSAPAEATIIRERDWGKRGGRESAQTTYRLDGSPLDLSGMFTPVLTMLSMEIRAARGKDQEAIRRGLAGIDEGEEVGRGRAIESKVVKYEEGITFSLHPIGNDKRRATAAKTRCLLLNRHVGPELISTSAASPSPFSPRSIWPLTRRLLAPALVPPLPSPPSSLTLWPRGSGNILVDYTIFFFFPHRVRLPFTGWLCLSC